MKAERRQVLRENDLAHAMTSARTYMRENGKRATTGVLAILALVVGVSFAMRSRAASQEELWSQKRLLGYETVEEGRKSLESLSRLLDKAIDPRFTLIGLMDQGSQSIRLALQAENAPDPALNEQARGAFISLLDKFKDNPIAFGVARCGLANVEANAFVLDGDISHKERAQEHLTAVIDNPALNGTSFQRIAIDRRDGLDATFTTIAFAPPRPPDTEDDAEIGDEPDIDPETGLPCDEDGNPIVDPDLLGIENIELDDLDVADVAKDIDVAKDLDDVKDPPVNDQP